MTVTVTIKNEGPHASGVMYYDEKRQFKAHADKLQPGEQLTVNVWDGHLPVVLPCEPAPDETQSFFRCPPASAGPLD